MDILLALYFVVGLILGMERLSRVTKDDEHGMMSIGIMAIIVLWPLYIIYIMWKRKRKRNK